MKDNLAAKQKGGTGGSSETGSKGSGQSDAKEKSQPTAERKQTAAENRDKERTETAEGNQSTNDVVRAAVGRGVTNLDTVGVIPVTLTLNVGSKEMLISEVVKLSTGSIVQFDHRESDPLDICVNGTLIGRGEVVLIGEHYGLRVLEIL